MREFSVIHKYCHCVIIIEGYDVYEAMKRNDLDSKYWIIK